MAVTFRHTEEFRSASFRHQVGYQWEEVAYEGAVLEISSREVPVGLSPGSYGQSYYAVVWNAEKGEPEQHGLHLVAYDYPSWPRESWGGWTHSATVDATPEAKAAYAAWQETQKEEKTQREHEANLREALETAGEVQKGSYVELNRKRCKVPYGTRGHVFWLGSGQYGDRVGFEGDDGETYWTAARNVSVVSGHENWEGLCQTCGGGERSAHCSWVPRRDGKGGRKSCPECSARHAEAKAEAEAKRSETPPAAPVTKGARVKVTRSTGRDAPEGTTGRVFWLGASKFGPGQRVGLQGTDGGTYWAALENVEAA